MEFSVWETVILHGLYRNKGSSNLTSKGKEGNKMLIITAEATENFQTSYRKRMTS